MIPYTHMSTIGHESIVQFFEKVQTNGNLSHAYCFVGPKHVGKMHLAKELSAKLLGTTPDKLGTHPDCRFIAQEINKKTQKTKKNIDIEQIRQLKSYVSGQPFVASHKVVIIDGAEKLNQAAANGLLKTLEEPAAHTTIFLLTPDETTLPETIISRCQLINIHPVAPSIIEQAIASQTSDAQTIAKLSRGLPGLAITFINQPEVLQEYQETIDQFTSLIGQPLYKKRKTIDAMFGDKTDHIGTRMQMINTLRIWQLCVRDLSIKAIQPNGLVHHTLQTQASWPSATATQTDNAIINAIKKLQQNVHPRLLVEHILLTIP